MKANDTTSGRISFKLMDDRRLIVTNGTTLMAHCILRHFYIEIKVSSPVELDFQIICAISCQSNVLFSGAYAQYLL